MRPLFYTLCTALNLTSGAAFAQAPMPNLATATAVAQPAVVVPGSSGTLVVTVAVKPGFHVNANKPNDPDYIPTTFAPTAPSGISFGSALYPKPKSITTSYSQTPLLVYIGSFVVKVPYHVAKSARAGHAAIGGTLSYQACNSSSCFPPDTAPVRAAVTVK